MIFRLSFCLVAFSLNAAAAPSPKINYEEHIRPILKARCFKCHSDDEQKADLNLQNYTATMKGGSGGESMLPGKPNSSLLFQAITHADGVEKMPPKSDKMPEAEIELFKKWILAGLPENSGSSTKVTAVVEFKAMAATRPAIPPMPGDLPKITIPPSIHPLPVTALAVSPWAPLVAVAGPDCIKLIHSENKQPLGLLPFPEGIPFVLRFSRDGAVLLAAGGNPVQSGKVALFDVKSGKRLATYGDETDVVLAADFSADGQFVALGGPGKIVKVFHAKDGKLAYKIGKHTDWITALEFSPDGSKLATGDRAGGIHVWDSASGGIVFSLSEHKDSITALTWRPDGALLASASEDGGMIQWNMKDGWPAQTLNPHTVARKAKQYGKLPNGVLWAQFTSTGQLLSTGRDSAVRCWGAQSEKPEFSLPDLGGQPTKVTTTSDGKFVVIGDAQGTVRLWNIGDSKGGVTVLQ